MDQFGWGAPLNDEFQQSSSATDHRHALPSGTEIFEFKVHGVLGSSDAGITYDAIDLLTEGIGRYQRVFSECLGGSITERNSRAENEWRSG